MGLFDNAKKNIEVVRDNLNFMRQTRLSNNYKNKKSNEDIKGSLYPIKNEYIEFIEKIGLGSSCKQVRSILVKSFFEEKNEFYQNNMKTVLFKTLINKISSRVLDDYEYLDVNNEPVEKIKFINGIDFKVKKHELKSISENLLLYGVTHIKVDIINNEFILKVVEPYKIIEFDNGFGYLFKKNAKILLEKRFFEVEKGKFYIQILEYNEKDKELVILEEYENSFNNNLIFKLESNLEIVTDGLLEMLMMYSQLFGSVQKEILMSTIKVFADKGYLNSEGYDYLREAYVPVSTPDQSESLTDSNKPLFQTYQSDIRAEELNKLRDFIKDEISTVLQMDKASLGIDTTNETATASVIKLSQTADTINTIKKIIEEQVNKFLNDFTSNSISINIPDYQVKNEEKTLNNVTSAINSKTPLITLKTAINKLHENWTEEQKEVEYLTIMFQNGIIFTSEQEKRAIELNIMEEPNNEGFIPNIGTNGIIGEGENVPIL